MILSDRLLQAIRDSGLSREEIAHRSGYSRNEEYVEPDEEEESQ